jgi:methyltransferase (TIGR00027 family)
MSDDSAIGDVSDTAFWVAYYRGLEGERRNPLFRDPLSRRLAGERGRSIAESLPGAHFTSWMMAIRTVVIDAFIEKAISEGADTILNLGAGLDTRPYRMDLASELNWIEADHARIVDYKAALLKDVTPRCRLSRMKVDLADGEARRNMLREAAAGAKKLLVLTEGVILYLDEDDVAELARDIRSVAVYWIVDYLSPLAQAFRPKEMTDKMKSAPLKFQPADWRGFLAAQGWRCRELRYLADEGDAQKRRVEFPFWTGIAFLLRALFMSAEKRAAFRTVMGYALMVPDTERGAAPKA